MIRTPFRFGLALFLLSLSLFNPVRAETPPYRAPDLFPVTHHATPEHDPIVLVENGKAVATICILDVPEVQGRIQAFRHALSELQDTIELATGVRLPVVHGEIREPAIILGNGPAAEAAGLRGADLPPEGFVIKTAPGRVYIVGHDDPREELMERPNGSPQPLEGTAWGVFEFLERFVGVRWYGSTETAYVRAPYEQRFVSDPGVVRLQPSGRYVPQHTRLSVPPTYLSDQPVFAMRGGEHPWPAHLRTLHAAQRLMNTHPINISVHQPHQWGAFPEIVEKHPEVMELRADGTRGDRMLCFSNPETLEVFLHEMERVLDDGEPVDRRRIGIRGNAISVSPWDRFPNCQCDACRSRVDKTLQFAQGSYSFIIADFTRRLALRVKERWPDMTVIYLPYQNYTAAPEGIEFPDNVEVQICGMGGIAALRESSVAEQWHQNNLERWHALTDRKVQTWEYSMYPAHRTHAAYQFPYILQRFYQRNRDILVGSFLNAATDHRTKFHVTAYIWARLLWNPDIDVDATLDEYARRMYGSAADTMREILQIQIDGWEQAPIRHDQVIKAEDLYRAPGGYTPERMERLRELLNQARRRVADDDLLTRRLAFYEEPFEAFFKEYERIVHGRGARDLTARKVEALPAPTARFADPLWDRALPVRLRKRGREPTVYASNQGMPLGEADARFVTEAKMVWTPDTVVVSIRAWEPDMAGLFTREDPVVDRVPQPDRQLGTPGWDRFDQDAVEILLNPTGPGGDPDAIAHLIVNAAGQSWEVGPDGTPAFMKNRTVKVQTDDHGWTVEVHLPVADLLKIHPEAKAPDAGEAWYGQIARLRHPEGKRDGIREQQKMNTFYHSIYYDTRNTADFAPIRFAP